VDQIVSVYCALHCCKKTLNPRTVTKTFLGIHVTRRFKNNTKNREKLHVGETRKQYSFLTPWNRVLLEKLAGSQLVKKFPAYYGTRKLITSSTSARHLPLSLAISIQSITPHPTTRRSILTLSSHLRLAIP
jgi:hypothetical protein